MLAWHGNLALSPEPTLEQLQARQEYVRLMTVRQIIGVMQRNNEAALTELLYRLTNSFKGRVILDANDTASAEEMAQALLTAVLMSSLVEQTVQKYEVRNHEGAVLATFDSEADARAHLARLEDVRGSEITPLHDA